MSGQADDETAKRGAMDACRHNSDRVSHGHACEIYAVGDTVVYERGRPPMPSQPWFAHDPLVERPLVIEEFPLISNQARQQRASYLDARKSKAWAVAPGGTSTAQFGQTSEDEAVRRSLENCGLNAGVPCLIVAIDDMFVVPVPKTMKVTGFFSTRRDDIAPEMRDAVAQRLAATRGWSAVALGTSGHPGVATKAANEQDAVSEALADCAKRDRNCHVVAIGPFAVVPR